MDDIGAIIFLIIFAISLVGSLIQKMTGAGQQGPDDQEGSERPRASDLPAATRRQIYGTGSPRAAEADDDEDDEPVEAIPVQTLWQQRQQRQQQRQQREGQSGATATAPPPVPRRREAPAARTQDQEAFRAREQAPWRAAEQAPSPEAAQQAANEAAERARRQREAQRHRARESAREKESSITAERAVARLAQPGERLASNEERMRAQRKMLAKSLGKGDDARQRLAPTPQKKQDFRSAPIKRKPRRSAQLTQLGRLMRNERAIRTGIIFSEILGKPKALREETNNFAS